MTRRALARRAVGLTLALALSATAFACYVATTFDPWPCQTEGGAPVCEVAGEAFDVAFYAAAPPIGWALCSADTPADAHARGDAGDVACWWSTYPERAAAAQRAIDADGEAP